MQRRPEPDRIHLVGAAPAGGASSSPALVTRVTGTCRFASPATGEAVEGMLADGVLAVTGFGDSGGALVLTGTLTGTCTAAGATGPAVAEEVTLPVVPVVTRAPQTCRTLRLLVGSIGLDTPEYAVYTSEVVLAVTATTGPGNLLGNLLGAVASSLTSDAPASHVAELLDTVVVLAG